LFTVVPRYVPVRKECVVCSVGLYDASEVSSVGAGAGVAVVALWVIVVVVVVVVE